MKPLDPISLIICVAMQHVATPVQKYLIALHTSSLTRRIEKPKFDNIVTSKTVALSETEP